MQCLVFFTFSHFCCWTSIPLPSYPISICLDPYLPIKIVCLTVENSLIMRSIWYVSIVTLEQIKDLTFEIPVLAPEQIEASSAVQYNSGI